MILVYFYPQNSTVILEKNVENYQLTIIEKKPNYYLVKDRNHQILYLKFDIDIDVGSIIKVNGKINRLKSETIPLVFNFASYLKQRHVAGQLEITKLEVLYNYTPIKSHIISALIKNLSEETSDYVKLILFGVKSENTKNLYNDLFEISATQLFIISGFHFALIKKGVEKLLSKLLVNKKIIVVITFSLLLFYLYLLDFSLSSTKAFCFYLLIFFNEETFDNYFSRMTILSFLAIIFLFYDQYLIYSLSYILSFIVGFTIEFLKGVKLRQFKYLSYPFQLALVILPLVLLINYEYHLLSLIINVILSFPTAILYALSMLTLTFPFLDRIYLTIMFGYETIIKFISSLPLNIIFGKVEPWFILSYYTTYLIIITFLQMKLNKHVIYAYISLFLLLIVQYYSPHFKVYDTIHFIDVGQGDSILIQGAYNRFNILVDTGGNRSYDLATKRLIPYIKALGIKKLDVLFISHDDFDHNGAKKSLMSNFKVDRLIEGNDFKKAKVNGYEIENLNNAIDCKGDNECSNVLYLGLGGLKILLTGDMPISKEKQIMENYEQFPVDILKVGHHGSKTSSSSDFISYINPTYAVISVGPNFYGHPNFEVLYILKKHNVKYYITRNDGSVIFKIYQNKYQLSLISP